MKQKFKHSYKDSCLEFHVEACNDEDEWANLQELIEALLKVIKCTYDWKQFEFHVVVKEEQQRERHNTSQTSHNPYNDWRTPPDLA